MNWNELAKLEPKLQKLFDEAKAIDPGDNEHFCANHIWYNEFKPRVSSLVGWERATPPVELQTEDAYDIAYQTIYDQLPGCRDCGCW